jgi:Holliday junction resolvase
LSERLALQLLVEKLDKEYKTEEIQSFKVNYRKCLFCGKWIGIFHIETKDNTELVYCPSCESIHKTLSFNKAQEIKTYVKGRAFEYQVKKLLESQGFIVFRCASSKPLDLVAFRMGKVLVCECKTSSVSKKDKEKLGEWSVKLGFPVSLFTKVNSNVQVEVFEPSERREWRNTYQLLEDFIQFLLENHSQGFPDGDCWVNLSQLDSSNAIWNFLFGKEGG